MSAGMLFKVSKTNDLRKDNPTIATFPEFDRISDRNLKWIFLVYDYRSPYKQLTLEDRKVRAMEFLEFPREKEGDRFDKNARQILAGEAKGMNEAIARFKSLIYNEDMEDYNAITTLIRNNRKLISTFSNSAMEQKKKSEIAKDLPQLVDTRKKLAQILDIKDMGEKEEEVTSTRKTEKSTLEKFNDEEL